MQEDTDGSASPLLVQDTAADPTGKHALAHLHDFLKCYKARMQSSALGVGACCLGAVAVGTSGSDVSATYFGAALALVVLAVGVQFLSSRSLRLIWSAFLIIAPSCWSIAVMLMSKEQVDLNIHQEPGRRHIVQLAYFTGGIVHATFPGTSKRWKLLGLAYVVLWLIVAGVLIYWRTGIVSFAVQVALLNNIVPCVVGFSIAWVTGNSVRLAFHTIAQLQAQLSVTSEKLNDASAQLRAQQTLNDAHIPMSDVRLLEVLGAGGMGVVYRGEWLGTPVAVKVLQRRQARSAVRPWEPPGASQGGSHSHVEAELQEARTLARASRHPCVCRFFGTTTIDGSAAIVMECLLGGSVADLVRVAQASNEELCPGFVCRMLQEVAAGVAFLHQQGVMHRDIKTENVLLDEMFHAKVGTAPRHPPRHPPPTSLRPHLHFTCHASRASSHRRARVPCVLVQVGDFGIAKATMRNDASSSEGDTSPSSSWSSPIDTSRSNEGADLTSISTRHTSGVGTLRYLAPEACLSQTYDERCDVYSFGCAYPSAPLNPRPPEPSPHLLLSPHQRQLPVAYSQTIAWPDHSAD